MLEEPMKNALVTVKLCTVNGERFTGLNFRIFYGFQEYCESFSVTIHKLHIMALFKCFKRKALQKYPREKLHWVESAKV